MCEGKNGWIGVRNGDREKGGGGGGGDKVRLSLRLLDGRKTRRDALIGSYPTGLPAGFFGGGCLRKSYVWIEKLKFGFFRLTRFDWGSSGGKGARGPMRVGWQQ